MINSGKVIPHLPTDIDDNSRIRAGLIDVGAYEYQDTTEQWKEGVSDRREKCVLNINSKLAFVMCINNSVKTKTKIKQAFISKVFFLQELKN